MQVCVVLFGPVRDIHSLVIRSVCHSHAGVYKSVISNKVGKATCYAHLYVTGESPPPEHTPGDRSLLDNAFFSVRVLNV